MHLNRDEWLAGFVVLMLVLAFTVGHFHGKNREKKIFQQAKKEWIAERNIRGFVNAPPGSIFIDRDKVNLYLCENVNGFGDNIGCVQCHTPKHGG